MKQGQITLIELNLDEPETMTLKDEKRIMDGQAIAFFTDTMHRDMRKALETMRVTFQNKRCYEFSDKKERWKEEVSKIIDEEVNKGQDVLAIVPSKTWYPSWAVWAFTNCGAKIVNNECSQFNFLKKLSKDREEYYFLLTQLQNVGWEYSVKPAYPIFDLETVEIKRFIREEWQPTEIKKVSAELTVKKAAEDLLEKLENEIETNYVTDFKTFLKCSKGTEPFVTKEEEGNFTEFIRELFEEEMCKREDLKNLLNYLKVCLLVYRKRTQEEMVDFSHQTSFIGEDNSGMNWESV